MQGGEEWAGLRGAPRGRGGGLPAALTSLRRRRPPPRSLPAAGASTAPSSALMTGGAGRREGPGGGLATGGSRESPAPPNGAAIGCCRYPRGAARPRCPLTAPDGQRGHGERPPRCPGRVHYSPSAQYEGKGDGAHGVQAKPCVGCARKTVTPRCGLLVKPAAQRASLSWDGKDAIPWHCVLPLTAPSTWVFALVL